MSVGPPPRRARSIAHASAACTAKKVVAVDPQAGQSIRVGPRGERRAAGGDDCDAC